MENFNDANTLARSIENKIIKGTDIFSHLETNSGKSICLFCSELYNEVKSDLLMLEKIEGKSKRYFEIRNFLCEAIAILMYNQGQQIFIYTNTNEFHNPANLLTKELYKNELNGMLSLMTTLLNECTSYEIKNKIKNYGDSIYLTINRFEKKEGCFIATAVLGDYNNPIVMDLRIFRDDWLFCKNWGKSFIKWYYRVSPWFAEIIKRSNLLKKITYIILITPLHYIVKKIISRGMSTKNKSRIFD